MLSQDLTPYFFQLKIHAFLSISTIIPVFEIVDSDFYRLRGYVIFSRQILLKMGVHFSYFSYFFRILSMLAYGSNITLNVVCPLLLFPLLFRMGVHDGPEYAGVSFSF